MAKNEDGFTLIEVIVAIAVLSLALAALLEGLALGWRGSRAAQMELAALQIAKSRLAAAGIETPLQDGRWTGITDGFRWVVTSVRHSLEPATVPTGYWITVEVGWRAGPWSPARTLELSTMKIGQAR